MGTRIPNPPKIFHVNWFRRDDKGKFIWPGFGENIRALKWILSRVRGENGAVETPIGYTPGPKDLDLDGLGLPLSAIQELLTVEPEAWTDDLQDQHRFFEKFGDRMPPEIRQELATQAQRLKV